MKKPIAVFAIGILAASSTAAIAQSRANAELTQATGVLQKLTGTHANAGIPGPVLHSAKCIAVVPKMLQAGFVIGGRHGNGVATCKMTNGSWSPPAPFSLTGASFGAQIGGQEMGYVMMIMNNKGMQALDSGHFKVGAGVSAAAGPVGREASGSGGWKAAILSYSLSKGAYVGATIQGAELNQDHDATKQLYGREIGFSSILNGHAPMPQAAPAHRFIATVRKAVANG